MTQPKIVLIGYEDQANLGIGYLDAVLQQNGFAVDFLDYRLGERALLQEVEERDPLIIGLSLIFQYYTPAFARLIKVFRSAGVTAHICTGGHYPSLRCEDALLALPGLDSIVRFEGEHTLLELAQRLAAGEDWHDINSIAYLDDEGADVETPLRQLIDDLDQLPFPTRRRQPNHCLGVAAETILASRGCPRGCTFCSIRRFYAIPPGRLRRTRSAANVLREMVALNEAHDVRVFLFQDDDFFLIGRSGQRWAAEFLQGLDEAQLSDQVLWKISCRSDEVDFETFKRLKEKGLFGVYLGIESGNETGLQTLNKNITVAQNLAAVQILNSLGIDVEFGFMLFDPSSTMELVLENVRFIRQIAGDGCSPAPFCKMLPYAGTDIEEELRREGRLRGDVVQPDYTFLDPRLDGWYTYLSQVLYSWVFDAGCLLAQLRWARFELNILQKFYPASAGLAEHVTAVRSLVQWYNEVYCRLVEYSAPHFMSPGRADRQALEHYQFEAKRQKEWIEQQLAEQRQNFFARAGIARRLVAGVEERETASSQQITDQSQQLQRAM